MRLILSFFTRYALPYWFWFVGGFICLFVTNWVAVQIPLQLAAAVDGLRQSQTGAVQKAAIWIALMGATVIFVRTLSRVLFFTPGRLVEFQMKNELFKKLLALQPAFYAKWRTGDIVSRASDDMSFVRVMVGFGLLQIFNTSTALIMTGAKMFSLSVKLTSLVLVPIILSMIVVNIGIGRFFALIKKSREQLSDLSDHILSSLRGVQTIQGFRAEGAFTDKFKERNQSFLETNLSIARIAAFLFPLLGLGGAVCIWALLSIGGPMTVRGELSVGQLVAFTSYIAYLLFPLRSLGWLMSVFQRGYTSLSRVVELLDAESERPEGKEPKTFESQEGIALEIQDLSFAYPDESEHPVLRDLSFSIPQGKTMGVFGRTGSGKTTLLRLLTRSYNPPEGTVFVNGTDLTHIDLNEWRDQLAVVPQSPFLFSDTIESNISMGGHTKEEIKEAISRAAFDQDLSSLTDGLDTVVGERGIMLSGGQRQRITLARALAQQFNVLVLDDVLSAVDHNTERRLIATIDSLSDARTDGSSPTVLLVSHRLSALAHTESILVLEEGQLIDQGTHEELTQRPGPYRDAWLHQSDAIDEEKVDSTSDAHASSSAQGGAQ